MRLYIIRHADPDYPNNTITPAGHKEAAALGVRMAKLGVNRIYSSPLGRAIHTMQYTAAATGLSSSIEEWTAEIGDCAVEMEPWGKMAVWDVPGENVRAKRPYVTAENWHTHELFVNPIFKSTFEKVGRNSDAFLARHGYVREEGRYRIEKGNREKIAVFCHGGFGLWWLAHLLELPLPLMWTGFHLPPSSVTTVLFDERSRHWAVPRCVGVGDVSHLYAAGLPTAPAGIKANVD
jgi:broad specificity phosphatase PhoE